jgi:alkanesulfonate monooxygenase SsuD/methylene tetrahydromethanopterin reductase-like flavin-dependent oxidoreductase (luciferase family)
MKFDYYVLSTYVPEADGDGPELYAKWIEQVALAEELGFDCAWFTEHHFGRFGGMLPSPQLFMAALAQHTTTIRLGTAVVLLPLHHPVRIAEETAMLDILSNGRLEVGVGRGMATQPYWLFGTDPAEAQEKLEEQVQILIGAWTSPSFSWEGKHYSFAGPVTLRPRPVQRPHPPLWMPTGSTPEHSRWIGSHGINQMTIPWLQGFETVRRVIDQYQVGLREGGFAADHHEVLAYLPAYVGETPERARAESQTYWRAFREVSDEDRGSPSPNFIPLEALVADSRVIFGDAEECRGHVRRIIDELPDVTRLALMFHFGGMPQELALASMRRFARDVAPEFAEPARTLPV